MSEDVFRGNGVKIDLVDEKSFPKIKETLTRIGIASKYEKKLFQSCHILHKRGEYAIVHFKEMFILDGKGSDFSEEDRARRNTITKLLEDWGLLKVKNKDDIKLLAPLSFIKILTFKEKDEWILSPKYLIGNVKKNA